MVPAKTQVFPIVFHVDTSKAWCSAMYSVIETLLKNFSPLWWHCHKYTCDKVQISNYKQFTEKDIIKSSLCVMIILN